MTRYAATTHMARTGSLTSAMMTGGMREMSGPTYGTKETTAAKIPSRSANGTPMMNNAIVHNVPIMSIEVSCPRNQL